MISFFTIFFKYLILVCLSLQGYMLSPFDNRSNRTIIWQAGSNYPRIKKTRCLADKHNIDYIQTFRFIELNNSLRETIDKSTKNTDPCGVNVKIILYIGPTRKQLNSLEDISYWLTHNYQLYNKNKDMFEQIFGHNNIMLQIYDEPSNFEDIEIINSFCKLYPNHSYFLSTNKKSLQFIKYLPIKCFKLIDFHSYGTAQQYPQIFIKLINSFILAIQSDFDLDYSITVPIFNKYVKESNNFERRTVHPTTIKYLVDNYFIKPSYYGAYLSPNTGFMQDDNLYSLFEIYTEKN